MIKEVLHHQLVWLGFIASFPMFQSTKDDELFDDLPYWNVSCIIPVSPLLTIPLQLADDADRYLPDYNESSNVPAAINPPGMEMEVKFERSITPSSTANPYTEF